MSAPELQPLACLRELVDEEPDFVRHEIIVSNTAITGKDDVALIRSFMRIILRVQAAIQVDRGFPRPPERRASDGRSI